MARLNLRNLDEYDDNFPQKKKFKKRKKFQEEGEKNKTRRAKRQ